MLTTICLWPLCLAASVAAPISDPPHARAPHEPRFAAPVRLQAAGEYVKVEAPGYAAPCWTDVDGDGNKDLVVGQFAGGKLRVYRNLGDGELAAGEWLEAEGDVAQVPGVW